MLLFFRLPFVLLELVVRQGARGLGTLVRLVRGGEPGDVFGTAEPRRAGGATVTDLGGGGMAVAEGEPVVTQEPGGEPFGGALAEEPAPPTAEEAIQRRREREAADVAAPPVREPEAQAPLPGEEGHVDSEPTLVESFGPEEDVAGALTVDEPWDDYDGMPATAVVARLRGVDEATKAVVRLYELAHKRRQTILRATA